MNDELRLDEMVLLYFDFGRCDISPRETVDCMTRVLIGNTACAATQYRQLQIKATCPYIAASRVPPSHRPKLADRFAKRFDTTQVGKGVDRKTTCCAWQTRCSRKER